MKKLLFTLTFSTFVAFSFAQNVGINTTGATPDPSAALDIDYSDKGLLIPRVALTSTTDIITIPAPATSLLVYNTNAAMTGGALGYWYWDGAAWIQAIGPAGPMGPAGPAGANGTNGTNGTNGAPGATGPQGPIGPTGPAGANGTNGTNGTNGAPGATGPQGPIGPTGPAGANGTNGTNGTNGAPGATGPQGPIGPTGPAGANGTNGTNGTNGAPGATGPTGANGVTFKGGGALTADYNITSTTYGNIPGATVTFTAQTTTAVVIMSAAGHGFTNSMGFVQFRVMNGATMLGGTHNKIQSYDNATGTITTWACGFTKYITGLVVGNSYTFTVQGRIGTPILGVGTAVLAPTTLPEEHVTISVIQ